ncbi:MAG: exodeoxyribonuclease VII large subunit [Burkholderiales bacterium]
MVSVSELNAHVRELLEGSLPLMWIRGEISNFTRAASGHCYFSLKDAQAQVRCVLFRHRAQLVDAPLGNGVEVEVRAVPTLYEARGDFQLNVDFVRRAGLGALFEAFERLKRKLEAEGLFDPGRKRELPSFPRAVGIVTSPQAAALRDVLTTLRRRMPATPVILYPTLVQGEGAASSIEGAIRTASARAEVDVLIVCRGGGSLEDLWAFNDESVARAIVDCPMPVVSGVGHETDFTIADFAADIRAPTPTAAAVLAVPDGEALLRRLAVSAASLRKAIVRTLEQRAQRVDAMAARLRHPGERIAMQHERLRHLEWRLVNGWQRRVDDAARSVGHAQQRLVAMRPDPASLASRLDALQARAGHAWRARESLVHARLQHLGDSLSHLDPDAVLVRGYAIVRDARGAIVREAASLRPGEHVALTLGQGEADATIDRLRPD